MYVFFVCVFVCAYIRQIRIGVAKKENMSTSVNFFLKSCVLNKVYIPVQFKGFHEAKYSNKAFTLKCDILTLKLFS